MEMGHNNAVVCPAICFEGKKEQPRGQRAWAGEPHWRFAGRQMS
jgi:hypothetical protein